MDRAMMTATAARLENTEPHSHYYFAVAHLIAPVDAVMVVLACSCGDVMAKTARMGNPGEAPVIR